MYNKYNHPRNSRTRRLAKMDSMLGTVHSGIIIRQSERRESSEHINLHRGNSSRRHCGIVGYHGNGAEVRYSKTEVRGR